MPLDLDATAKFFSTLHIRDRDVGTRKQFKLRPQQVEIMERCKEHIAKKRRLYVIFLKARRVGISTWASAIQTAHCLSKSDGHAAIIAQIRETSSELFQQAAGFAKDLRPILPDIGIGAKQLTYPHQRSEASNLRHYTAATVHGTRGLTFSSVHMTEAAFYPYEGAYTAILNTLSKDPDNICLIETTANGMEGPGEAYYEYWQAAEGGDNEFLPIFLPWYEDPEYVMDPEAAEDAPRDDYERYLMHDLKDHRSGKSIRLGKDRIAWFRDTLFSKCEGSLDKWKAEYPSCLLGDTLVGTHHGIMPISLVREGYESESGEITKSGQTGFKACVEILTKSGRILRGTFDHPIQKEDGSFVWMQDSGGCRIRLCPMRTSEFMHVVEWHKELGVHCSREITHTFARFLGYFMGDGCYHGNTVSIACCARDEDVVADVSRLMGALFGNSYSRATGSKKGCTELRVGSVAWGEMMKVLGFYSPTSPHRIVSVPECIFLSPKEVIKEFLTGLFEADGFNAYPTSRVVLFSKHVSFLRDIQSLLLCFGITCKVSSRPAVNGQGRAYQSNTLSMRWAEAIKFNSEIGFVSEYKRSRSKEGEAPQKSLKIDLIDEVISLREIGEHPVFDLHVNHEDHVFSANGIACHNSPMEAFIATGSPAFTHEELQFAHSSQEPPLHRGYIVPNALGKMSFEEERSASGDDLLLIWEYPQQHAHYFAGVDTARGEETNITPGDYAAVVVWNAETGHMAARFMGRVSPEKIAKMASDIGRFYNDAALNVELNNLGYVVMRELRDRLFYPNQYRWKGRDDKFDGKPGTAFGFETTDRYRRMMFNLFRTALYRKECVPKDAEFVRQMTATKMEMGFRWNIAVGHDDVMMAALLGWIAKEQFHPQVCNPRKPKNLILTPEQLEAEMKQKTGLASPEVSWLMDGTSTALGSLMVNANDHLREIAKYEKRHGKVDRLAGL